METDVSIRVFPLAWVGLILSFHRRASGLRWGHCEDFVLCLARCLAHCRCNLRSWGESLLRRAALAHPGVLCPALLSLRCTPQASGLESRSMFLVPATSPELPGNLSTWGANDAADQDAGHSRQGWVRSLALWKEMELSLKNAAPFLGPKAAETSLLCNHYLLWYQGKRGGASCVFPLDYPGEGRLPWGTVWWPASIYWVSTESTYAKSPGRLHVRKGKKTA